MKKFFKIFGFVLTLAVLTFALFWGIKAQDYLEVERNATTICLSCMGIQ